MELNKLLQEQLDRSAQLQRGVEKVSKARYMRNSKLENLQDLHRPPTPRLIYPEQTFYESFGKFGKGEVRTNIKLRPPPPRLVERADSTDKIIEEFKPYIPCTVKQAKWEGARTAQHLQNALQKLLDESNMRITRHKYSRKEHADTNADKIGINDDPTNISIPSLDLHAVAAPTAAHNTPRPNKLILPDIRDVTPSSAQIPEEKKEDFQPVRLRGQHHEVIEELRRLAEQVQDVSTRIAKSIPQPNTSRVPQSPRSPRRPPNSARTSSNMEEYVHPGGTVGDEYQHFKTWCAQNQKTFHYFMSSELDSSTNLQREMYTKKTKVLHEMLQNDSIFHIPWHKAISKTNDHVTADIMNSQRSIYNYHAEFWIQAFEQYVHSIKMSEADEVAKKLRSLQANYGLKAFETSNFEEVLKIVPAHRLLLIEVLNILEASSLIFGLSNDSFQAIIREKRAQFDKKNSGLTFNKGVPSISINVPMQSRLTANIMSVSNVISSTTTVLPDLCVNLHCKDAEARTSVKRNVTTCTWNEELTMTLPIDVSKHGLGVQLEIMLMDTRSIEPQSMIGVSKDSHGVIGWFNYTLNTLPHGEKKRLTLQLKGHQHANLTLELLLDLVPSSRATVNRGWSSATGHASHISQLRQMNLFAKDATPDNESKNS